MRALARSLMVLALALGVLAGRAGAVGDDDKQTRARARFEAGRALYSLGDYEAALREFAAGYLLVPKPQFLINLGSTYRKLGDYRKSREMYRLYLAKTPLDDAMRPSVERVLVELDEEEAKHPPAPPAAPVAPVAPPSATLNAPPSTSVAAPTIAPQSFAVAPAPPPKHFDRRHLGWIIPVAVVAAAGLSVGIYFAARPSSNCPANVLCIDSTSGR
jgi:tetratricopeptide (TPR) repeat protein